MFIRICAILGGTNTDQSTLEVAEIDVVEALEAEVAAVDGLDDHVVNHEGVVGMLQGGGADQEWLVRLDNGDEGLWSGSRRRTPACSPCRSQRTGVP